MQRGKGAPLEGQIDVGYNEGVITLKSLNLDDAISASGSLNTLTGEPRCLGNEHFQLAGDARDGDIFSPGVGAMGRKS